jgi:hypothetical protein
VLEHASSFKLASDPTEAKTASQIEQLEETAQTMILQATEQHYEALKGIYQTLKHLAKRKAEIIAQQQS